MGRGEVKWPPDVGSTGPKVRSSAVGKQSALDKRQLGLTPCSQAWPRGLSHVCSPSAQHVPFPHRVSSPAGAPGTPALGSHLDESCCHWRALFMLGDHICGPRETCKLLRNKPHWQGLLSPCSDLSFNKLLLSSSCLQSVLLSSVGDKAEDRSPFQKASQSIRGSKTYTCLQCY